MDRYQLVLMLLLLFVAASATGSGPDSTAAPPPPVTFAPIPGGELTLSNGVVRAVWRRPAATISFNYPTPRAAAAPCTPAAVKINGTCLAVARLERATPVTTSPCGNGAAGWQGWCVEADVQAPWLKVRLGGAQAGARGQGLCLQLHNGNVTAGNEFQLWNCSAGLDGTMQARISNPQCNLIFRKLLSDCLCTYTVIRDFQHGADKKLRLCSNADYCAAVAASGAIVLARCGADPDAAQDWTLPPVGGLPPLPPPPPSPDPPSPPPPPTGNGKYPPTPGWQLS